MKKLTELKRLVFHRTDGYGVHEANDYMYVVEHAEPQCWFAYYKDTQIAEYLGSKNEAIEVCRADFEVRKAKALKRMALKSVNA